MVNVDWLFLDMNAFFASAEQQLRPELRGRPVAVVPTMTHRTCCIAASYEARPYGVRTGTNVGEALRLCPRLVLVEARHERYVDLHHAIIAAVETVLPVEKVCSVDEMVCQLSPQHRSVAEAVLQGQRVKEAIYRDVGEAMRCSVGLATNRFLAKVASNLKKPDGLTVLTREGLPKSLYRMKLDDFPGIARNMRARLERRGVRSVRQLCGLSRDDMVDIWESVLGEQWWHWLRGDEVPDRPTKRRTVGHSHVLPPELRTDGGSRGVMVRLLHKAAARLRKLEHWAGRMDLSVSYADDRPRWKVTIKLGRCQDTPTMLRALDEAWQTRTPSEVRHGRPIQVAITLYKLTPSVCATPSLFVEERKALEAARTMDMVNDQLGGGALYFASMHNTKETAPMRIAFTNIPNLEDERGAVGGSTREGKEERPLIATELKGTTKELRNKEKRHA
ncbi:DNA polymerase IV [Pseudobythopirellula maris]|uniref:DNA polymerase IV n=1 Tax=Pseudobythopirellula maris TaxID=2527991 RepID=A0A5C5ZM28_9BACT|nr:DNA polymerase [Pseudobythopirellula maris]TWT88502.1 DNA polymerase IV [Pseudobythopirellula maris]